MTSSSLPTLEVKTNHFRYLLSFFLSLFIFFAALAYWSVTQRLEEFTLDRLKLHQLTAAKAGSLAINDFFEELQTHLVLLAQSPVVQKTFPQTAAQKTNLASQLASFFKNNRALLPDVARVNADGTLRWAVDASAPAKLKTPSLSVADRDYFKWSQRQTQPGGVFVSRPLIARGGTAQNQFALVLATPLFNQNRFDGCLLFVIPIESLIKKYVAPLASPSTSQLFIIDQNKTIVASSIPSVIGQSIFKDNPPENLPFVAAALAGQTGVSVHPYLIPSPTSLYITAITAYAPIQPTPNQTWSLLLSIPTTNIHHLAFPLKNLQSLILGVMISALLFLTLFSLTSLHWAHKEGFVNGFKDGFRDGLKDGLNGRRKKG